MKFLHPINMPDPTLGSVPVVPEWISADELTILMGRYATILDQYHIPDDFRKLFVRFVESGEITGGNDQFSACLESNPAYQSALEEAFLLRVGALRDAIRALNG